MPTVWPTVDGTNRYLEGQTSRAVQIFQMYGPSRPGHRPVIPLLHPALPVLQPDAIGHGDITATNWPVAALITAIADCGRHLWLTVGQCPDSLHHNLYQYG
jgi:hypothetical protein